MKIKIEQNVPEGQELSSAHVQIISSDTDLPLGGVQRLNIVYDAYDKKPKAYLEVINFSFLGEVDVEHIDVIAFGSKHQKIEDMSREELIYALKREAALRYRESNFTIPKLTTTDSNEE